MPAPSVNWKAGETNHYGNDTKYNVTTSRHNATIQRRCYQTTTAT